MGEAAGNVAVDERRLEDVADLVFPVEERDVAPADRVLAPVAADVVHDPRGFFVVRVERHHRDGEGRLPVGCRWNVVGEERRVHRDELARQIERLARAAVVLIEVNLSRQVEIVHEAREHREIGARPRIDRLLMIADGEHVIVPLGERAHDAILDGIEILKLVDENRVPPLVHARRVAGCLEQRRGVDDERIEVEHFPCGEEALVLREQARVIVQERSAAETVRREPIERVAMPAPRPFDAAQDAELILLVGDAKAALDADERAELAQQLGAEGVDRPRCDRGRRGSESWREPVRRSRRRLCS